MSSSAQVHKLGELPRDAVEKPGRMLEAVPLTGAANEVGPAPKLIFRRRTSAGHRLHSPRRCFVTLLSKALHVLTF